jgi:hypothetical protein
MKKDVAIVEPGDVVPKTPGEITKELVDTWADWYLDMARESVEGIEFDSEAQKEYEIYKRVLEICEAGTSLNDAIRQRALSHIARYQLYRHAPESWSDLSDVIRDALPSVTSAGYASELSAIAEKVAPFCERHNIPLMDDPAKLGYVREGASALRAIVDDGEMPEKKKVERVREELNFILHEATSVSGEKDPTSVRNRYRNWRGVPARSYLGKLEDGREVLLVVGEPATIRAVRQAAHRQTENGGNITVFTEAEDKPSKKKGQTLRLVKLTVEQTTMLVIDNETGEVKQEVLQ